METNTVGASSSRSSADVARELADIENRKKELEREAAEAAKLERGPVDREEALLAAFVDLAVGAAQHRPVNELRKRAGAVLEVLKGS